MVSTEKKMTPTEYKLEEMDRRDVHRAMSRDMSRLVREHQEPEDDGVGNVVITMVDGRTTTEVSSPILSYEAAMKVESQLALTGWCPVTSRVRSDYDYIVESIYYRPDPRLYMTYEEHHRRFDETMRELFPMPDDDEIVEIFGVTEDERDEFFRSMEPDTDRKVD